MPCRDWDDSPGAFREVENPETKMKLDNVTRLLCELMTQIDGKTASQHLNLSPELVRWWEAHKETDRKRKEAERQRKADTIREFKRKLAKAEKELKELE